MRGSNEKDSILLVEENDFIRSKINSVHKSNKDILIIPWRNGLKNTLTEINELNASVVLIDLDLLSQSCLSVVEIVKRDLPSAKIIVVGLEKDQKNILQLVQAKVNGFILKDSSPKEIITTIKNVDGGSTILPPLLINKFSNSRELAKKHQH
ncbi:MAG: response regulator [Melioribacteraceae bacterium]|nr:response regulator [Melioribacteraceae bacterium]